MSDPLQDQDARPTTADWDAMDIDAPSRTTAVDTAIPRPCNGRSRPSGTNPHRRDAAFVLVASAFSEAGMRDAEPRWRRLVAPLAELLEGTGHGRVGSPFMPVAPDLARTQLRGAPGSVWVEADHNFSVTGCCEAGGGVHEVLTYDEALAQA